MEKPKIEPLKELKKGQEYIRLLDGKGGYTFSEYVPYEDVEDVITMFDFSVFFHDKITAKGWISQQLNPEPEQWKPENREKYYFYGWLTSEGYLAEIFDATWRDDLSCCQERLAQNNVHKSKEDCETWSKKEYKSGEPIDGDLVKSFASHGRVFEYEVGCHWNAFATNAEHLQYLEEQKPLDQDVPRDKNRKELKVGDSVRHEETHILIAKESLFKDMDVWIIEDGGMWYRCDHCELIEPQEKGLVDWIDPFLDVVTEFYLTRKGLLDKFVQYIEQQQKGESK